MERGSTTHGRRLDEALKGETRGMMLAGHETRAEEWASSEPSGEDQPDVDLAPHTTLVGGVPEGMEPEDVTGRSELAAHLGNIWPANSQQMWDRAEEQHAPTEILAEIAALPEGEVYPNVAEAWRALTGAKEQHRF